MRKSDANEDITHCAGNAAGRDLGVIRANWSGAVYETNISSEKGSCCRVGLQYQSTAHAGLHRVFYNHGNVRGMDGGENMGVAADCLDFSWMRIRDLEFRRYKVSRWQVYGTSSELGMGVLGNLSDDIS